MKNFALANPVRRPFRFAGIVFFVLFTCGVVAFAPATDSNVRTIHSESDLWDALSDSSVKTLLFDGGNIAVAKTDTVQFVGTWKFNTSAESQDIALLTAPSISLLSASVQVDGAVLERIGANRSFALLEASDLGNYYLPETLDSTYDFLDLSVRKRSATNEASTAVTTRVEVSQSLRWERGTSTASGTFTLGKGQTFDVGVVLSNQKRPIIVGDIIKENDWEHGWDGKSLLKTGEGTLILSAVNQYTGTTTVEAGTLRLGTTDAIRSSSGVSVAEGATLQLGGYDQTLQGLSGTGIVVLDAGKTLTIAADTKSSFGGIFRSEGDLGTAAEILKTGRGIWEFTGSSTHALKLTVAEGKFVNNGNLAGQIEVLQGATLAGYGMYAAGATFRSGAVHSPGNSIDTNYTLSYAEYDAKSTVFMEVGLNGESDSINAVGGNGSTVGYINFSLGGTNGTGENDSSGTLVWIQNFHEQLDDKNAGSLEFTLFTASAGQIKINGETISNSSQSSADGENLNELTLENSDGIPLIFKSDASLYIDKILSETVNGQQVLKVYVTPNGLITPLTGNQQRFVDSLTDGQKVSVYSLSGDERRSLIDQLSPNVQSVMPYVHRRAVSRFNDTTFKRLEHLAYHGKSGCIPKGRQLWAEFDGDYTEHKNDEDYYGYKFKSWGGAVGLDVMLLRDFIAGVNVGGMQTDVDMKDGFQRAKSQLLLTSLYSMWFGNNWSVKTSVGYNWGENKTYRDIPHYGTTSDGKTHGNAVFAGVEIAKHLRYNHTAIVPFYKFDFINLWEDQYTEDNAVYGLAIDKRTTRGYLQTVGARIEHSYFTQRGCVITPSVYGGWIHDYGEGRIHTDASFTGGETFTYHGIGIVRDRALIGIGLNITPNENLTIFGRYEAELAEKFTSQIGNVGLGFLW